MAEKTRHYAIVNDFRRRAQRSGALRVVKDDGEERRDRTHAFIPIPDEEAEWIAERIRQSADADEK